MWHDFVPHFSHLRARATRLPFSVGGVVQPGRYPRPSNNQDAIGIDVDGDAIVAFVCDGCASNSPFSNNDKSFNEVGASLGAVVAAGVARRLLTQPAILAVPDHFIAQFAQRYVKSLWHLACHLAQSRLFGKDMRRHVIMDFLMSTLLGVVVTAEQFLIFGQGDGVVVVNGQTVDLTAQAGSYPLNDMVRQLSEGSRPSFTSGLAPISSGDASTLRAVMLASDGFVNFPAATALDALLFRSPSSDQRGYDGRFFREFRSGLAESEQPETFHDDRSLVVIRRVSDGPDTQEEIHHA